MSDLLTLVAASAPRAVQASLPAGYELRSIGLPDIEALGSLYFDAYDPGIACATPEEALDDIAATFNGAYGDLWLEASPVAILDDRLVAAAMTVRQAPWDDTPDGPFIIEIFTDRPHRRRGLARALVSTVLQEVRPAPSVGLRVAQENTAARRLYESLGFRNWRPIET